MARVSRFVPGFIALFIIASVLLTVAWVGGGGVSLAPTPTAASDDDTALPPGASQDWWGSVQEEIRQSEYRISWQEGTGLPDLAAAYQAPNRAQNLRTYFTESGIQVVPRADSTPGWNMGLTLTGYSYEGDSRPVADAEMSVEENRADYDRGDVAEWYVNTEEGLEQGFTLNAAPSGSAGQGSALILRISLSGDLTPALAEQGQAIDFITPGGVRVLRYSGLQVNDAEDNLLDAGLAVSGDGVSINIDAASATFPITVDPVVTSPPSWTAEGNLADANLGYSVATAGDVNSDGYSDVIVGAYTYSNGESQEGAVYVYHGSAGGLSTAPDWTGEGGASSAHFGSSVGTAGDVNGDGYADVIIGAEGYSNGESGEGAAFVYYGSASGLGDDGTPATADWKAESNQPWADFGESVGTAGDVNGDGFSDVIIGAWIYDNGQTDEGMAFVWHGASSGVNDDVDGTPGNAEWTAESNQGAAQFGCSVGTAGDVNGDGFSDVIVGARLYDNPDSAEGRAYVYHGSSSGLGTSAAWTAESDQAGAALGESVGTAGDVNGDGYADVIVGAYQYNNGHDGEGMALVWHGASSGVNGDVDGTPGNAEWTAEVNQTNAFFGRSVGTAGDVDGDGYADVIVGADLWDNGETNEGGAAIYRGSSVGLDATAMWAQEGNQAAADYGWSVATAGDVNGDGYADVIVGAHGYTNPESGEGRAYVYHGYASGLMATIPLWAGQSDQASASFGFSVGTAGDVNGDGYADVIVGAIWYDGGLTNEGRAYIYYGHGAAAAPFLTAGPELECNVEYAQFGFSVGTAGDVNGDGYDDVIIGANQYHSSEAEVGEGAAYVYYGTAGGLEATYGWRVEGDKFAAEVGASVGTAGDVNGDGYADVIVGAQYYDGTYNGEGLACVFHGSAAGLAATDNVLTADWAVYSGQANANFGCSVSTAGDVNRDGFSDVIVGAYGYGTGGAAFVYHGSAGGLSTTPAWSKEGNQEAAQYGRAVSTAGDVNGDGYADVIVGSWFFDGGQTDEGAAFVYHGSASGLSATQSWFAESNQAGAEFGWSVDGAGDVNGDGYADVIIGAPYYTNVQTDEGAAVLWCGSYTGLGANGTPLNADWGVEGSQEYAYFGCSVASAGDVNGDGYADVIIGGYGYSSPEAGEGGALLFYGGGRRGVSLNPRQERDSVAIAHLGVSDRSDAFWLGVSIYTPFGRGKAKVQYEVKPLGAAFNGSGLRETGVIYTATKVTFLVDGLSPNTVYHWRVRLHYSSVTTPFQQYSRWVTMPWNGWQEGDLRTANAPPVAVNDSYSTNEDTPLSVAAAGVLGNDTDADPLTAVKVSNPGHGTVTLNSNGSFTYTPAANYNGSDSFTYKANDGRDDSNTVTVIITVNAVNDAPSFAKGANQNVAEDSGAQTVSGWATAISAGPSDESGQTVNFIVTSDNTSLFSVQPAISADGTLTYTPAANAYGTATVTVRIHDNGGTASGGVDTSATQTFTISVTAVNDAPTATADAYSAHRDTALTVTAPGVLANDTDIEGNPLSAVLVSSVSHGALTLNADGSFTYTPSASYSGADSFTYHAYDGSDYSGTVTVSITVHAENNAPAAVGDSYTVAEDTALVVDVAAGVLINDTDADADTLKSTVVTNVSHGVLVLNDNGSFTYTPASNFNGTDSFTYKASDGLADSSAATVTITVSPVNDLPVATGDAYDAFAGIARSVPAPGVLGNDSDADGNALTAVLAGNVSHGTLTLNADGSFTYTAESGFAGADSFTYKVNDGTGDSAVATVTIQVALPEPPTITSITKSSGRWGSTQTVTITGTNLDGVTELYFGEGIAVSNPVAGSPTEVTAEITIASEAALGTRDVRITTPEGTYTLEDGFTVSKAKSGGVPFWVWILVAVGVVAAAAIGIVFWRKRSTKPA